MMNILLAAAALVATQAAQPARTDHSQHSASQHAQHQQGQHQGDHKCCKEVNGKMECQMMKGHGAQHQGQSGQGNSSQPGHQGH